MKFQNKVYLFLRWANVCYVRQSNLQWYRYSMHDAYWINTLFVLCRDSGMRETVLNGAIRYDTNR
jgi:hypothetical protein